MMFLSIKCQFCIIIEVCISVRYVSAGLYNLTYIQTVEKHPLHLKVKMILVNGKYLYDFLLEIIIR